MLKTVKIGNGVPVLGEPRDAPWDISITRHPSHDRQDLPAGVQTGCILICLREGFKVAAVGRKLQRIGTRQLIHCRGYFYLLPQVDAVFGVYNRQNRLDYLRWTPNISFFCTFVALLQSFQCLTRGSTLHFSKQVFSLAFWSWYFASSPLDDVVLAVSEDGR